MNRNCRGNEPDTKFFEEIGKLPAAKSRLVFGPRR